MENNESDETVDPKVLQNKLDELQRYEWRFRDNFEDCPECEKIANSWHSRKRKHIRLDNPITIRFKDLPKKE